MNPIALFLGLLSCLGFVLVGGVIAGAAAVASMWAAAVTDRGPRFPREKPKNPKKDE